MIDTTTNEGRAVGAALRLAARKPWAQVSLLDIADEAGITLADLSKMFASRGDVLAAFVRLVDEAVLRRCERADPGEAARERLFDVVMTRLEVMAPHRDALRRIAEDASLAPQLFAAVLASQRWMLAAAGLTADGLDGAVRTAGLASVYAATFRTWLEDDDAGLSKTMAALDRRLRRGESWMRRYGEASALGRGLLEALRGRVRRGPARPAEPRAEPSGRAEGGEPPASVH